MRGADPERRLGGARRLLPARRGDPDRARHEDALQAIALPDAELAGIARAARARALDEHTAARRAAELERRSRPPPRSRGAMPWARRPDMWGIIPAAGAGSRIQPLAFSKELLPVGSRLDGADERPRAVSEYLVERMVRGGADADLLRDLAGQVGHPGVLRRRASGRRHVCVRRAAAPGGAVRRDLPRPAARRARGGGRWSACPTPSGSRRTACCALDRRHALVSAVPGRAPGAVRRRGHGRGGRVREIQVKRPDAGSRWIWGAFKMPGARSSRELHALWRERDRARRVHRHAGQRVARARRRARGRARRARPTSTSARSTATARRSAC